MPTIAEHWNNYWKVNIYFPLRILIVLEILWAIVIAVFIPLYQLTGGISFDTLRLDLIILAFHISSIVSIVALLENTNKYLPIAPVVWLIFTVFTDLWSVLSIWLHVAEIPGIDQTYLGGLKGMSVAAICLSGLTVIAYIAILINQTMQAELVKDVRKYLEMDSKIKQTKQRLLP